MILSSILALSLISAQAPNDAGLRAAGPVWRRGAGSGFSGGWTKGDKSPQPPWSLLAPRREPPLFVWERGEPVLPQRWSLDLQGPVSAPLSLRPRASTDPEGFQSALVGTHTGRVLLVEWDRGHRRLAAGWNVDGMVTGAPRWLDRERFVVGTDADSLHAFVRSGAKAMWTRQVGRCAVRRSLGPLGSRCDLRRRLLWQGDRAQMVAVSDGVYALNDQGQMRWQWPPGGRLGQGTRRAGA